MTILAYSDTLTEYYQNYDPGMEKSYPESLSPPNPVSRNPISCKWLAAPQQVIVQSFSSEMRKTLMEAFTTFPEQGRPVARIWAVRNTPPCVTTTTLLPRLPEAICSKAFWTRTHNCSKLSPPPGIGRKSLFFMNAFKASGAAVLASERVRPSRSPKHLSRRFSLTMTFVRNSLGGV